MRRGRVGRALRLWRAAHTEIKRENGRAEGGEGVCLDYLRDGRVVVRTTTANAPW